MLPDRALSFDAALSHLADLLADARNLEHGGHVRRAEMVYALAEGYALRSGFLELLRLVWAYSVVPGGSGRRF
jgi:predicted alpha/beta hydrolase family esterase